MAKPIESPCIRVCVIDPPSGLCLGCKRSLREIAAWGSMPDETRARIMADLPARSVPQHGTTTP
ncbi:MAG: DUF1289 domain-containing protein [Alphaproteobacteria bacterium]|nr:DUF1289 domain-containing protein [Alphaproteobacteria bacterium]